MARSRNIKPGFFKNYDLADAGPHVQLLFAGLWCLADREGRLEDKPRFIKAELFPYYDFDVNGGLTELERLKFICRYLADDLAVIQVLNFKKHQSPHKTEKAAVLPSIELVTKENNLKTNSYIYNGDSTVNPPLDNDGKPPDSLIPDLLIPDSLIPEKKEVAVAPCLPDKPKNTIVDPEKQQVKKKQPVQATIPDDFIVSEGVMAWYRENDYKEDINKHLENFKDQCRAKGYTYASFDAAFKNAIRKDWAAIRNQQIQGNYNANNTRNNETSSGFGRKLSLAEQAERDIELLEQREQPEQGRRERVIN